MLSNVSVLLLLLLVLPPDAPLPPPPPLPPPAPLGPPRRPAAAAKRCRSNTASEVRLPPPPPPPPIPAWLNFHAAEPPAAPAPWRPCERPDAATAPLPCIIPACPATFEAPPPAPYGCTPTRCIPEPPPPEVPLPEPPLMLPPPEVPLPPPLLVPEPPAAVLSLIDGTWWKRPSFWCTMVESKCWRRLEK